MKKLKGIFLLVSILSFVLTFSACTKKTATEEGKGEDVALAKEVKMPPRNLNKELKAVKSTSLGDPNKVIARVNGTEVFNKDIQEKFTSAWKSYLKDYSRSALKNISKEEMIERLTQTRNSAIGYLTNLKISNLMYDGFLSSKTIEISDEELQAEIEHQIDLVLFFSDGIHKTQEEFFKEVERNQLLTKEEFFQDVARNVKIMSYFINLIPVSVKEEVESTLEERYNSTQDFIRPRMIDLSAIVINYASDDEANDAAKKVRDQDAAFALAEKIVAQLAAGDSFEKLAKKYSDSWNKETKAIYQKNFDGNGLSFLQPAEIEIVKALEKDQTTGILENRGGSQLLIFKADKIVEKRQVPFETVKFQMLVAEISKTEEGREAKKQIDEAIRAIEVVQGEMLEVTIPDETEEDQVEMPSADQDAE